VVGRVSEGVGGGEVASVALRSEDGACDRPSRDGRRVWVLYLTTGAALAVSRVALFVWLYHHSTTSRAAWYLVLCCLHAEYLLASHTPLFFDMDPGTTEYFLVWGSLVTLGSFVMATPILLVGWLVRRGRRVLVSYLSAGAALAVTRVALLMWITYRFRLDTVADTVNFLVRWLYPESLVADYDNTGLINLSRTEYYLLLDYLVALGSFVLATPILLVGWLVRRRRQNLARS
jgi:hypothetical protein